MELTRLKIESHDPIFFTGTRARSWVSGNDWLQCTTLNTFKDCHLGYLNLKIYRILKKLRLFNSHVGYKILRSHSPMEFFIALAMGLLLKSNTVVVSAWLRIRAQPRNPCQPCNSASASTCLPGRGPTRLRARVRNRDGLENWSQVVPKTEFQDGGGWTRIFTHKINILA